jgi:hypothetical protein
MRLIKKVTYLDITSGPNDYNEKESLGYFYWALKENKYKPRQSPEEKMAFRFLPSEIQNMIKKMHVNKEGGPAYLYVDRKAIYDRIEKILNED